MGVENIKVEAMKVYYGEDGVQSQEIVISPAITKASLAGKYFHAYGTLLGVLENHVFWFDTTGSDVAPVVAGAILHEVDISSGALDTAAEWATTLGGIINGVTGVFIGSASNNVVSIVCDENGYVPACHDSKQPLKITNFGFKMVAQGDLELELGCINGDIEVAMEESFLDVTCHANGVTPVAQLKTGVSTMEVTLSLQETTTAQLKKMFTKSGGSFIPDGGTEVFGMGTYKNFENMMKYAAKLRLHPARLLEGDTSEDWQFHKAMPQMSSITFSGENVFELPVTFKVYPAEGIDSKVNYFAIGDSAQSLA